MARIQILTTSGCPSCSRVKEILDKMRVRYETINIAEHPEILQKFQVRSVLGIVIDGKLEFTGVPSKEELKQKLNNKTDWW